MDINQLTIGQARELANLFSAPNPIAAPESDPLVGKYVICRCYSAGVHAGTLVSQTGDTTLLKDARRLWSWSAKAGVALSGVAANGLASGCKVDSRVSLIRLTEVIETIMTSDGVSESINDY